jgi:NitT/TauT family transport system substrate-binding protein
MPGELPMRYILLTSIFAVALCTLIGCKKSETTPATGSGKVEITLDWKPEPEFGGFYQATLDDSFRKRGLDVTLRTAGEGAPTWQLVAGGQAMFATTAADQVLIARAHGADVVAIYAVYQTFPQGILVHGKRGFKTIQDVFNSPGTLAAEDDTWLHYLVDKYKPIQVKVTGYSGGIAAFLAKADYSQQCFVTSEPLIAAKQGADVQTFLIADAGYNPYTTVLITSQKTIDSQPKLVQDVVEACREGWRHYLDNPSSANAAMSKLNPDMSPDIFKAAAEAQKPLIETTETGKSDLGMMAKVRWNQLAEQLVALKVIDQAPDSSKAFHSFTGATTLSASN